MTQQVWLTAQPRSPLVFRSGRPFGGEGQSGGDDGYSFPMPATLAGAVRSAWVDATNPPTLDHAAIRQIAVHGPLLVGSDGRTPGLDVRWLPYFTPPLDAVQVKRGLPPQKAEPNDAFDFQCDLPHGLLPLKLAVDNAAPSKVISQVGCWSKELMVDWLRGTKVGRLDPQQIAILPVDLRTHAGLQTGRKVGDEGRLFQSAGVAFGPQSADASPWKRRYALAFRTSDAVASSLNHRVARVGADGRSVRYGVPRNEGLFEMPDALRQALLSRSMQKGQRFRLVLATPAVFASGWRPDWLVPNANGYLVGRVNGAGASVRLVSAAVGRCQSHSGWRMERDAQGRQLGAKATRRVVPSGSVYWFEWLQKPSMDELDALYLQSISSDEQDRRDGWALVLPGVASERGTA